MQGLWDWDSINGRVKWVAFDYYQIVWGFRSYIAWCVKFKRVDGDLEDAKGDYSIKFWVEICKELDWYDQTNSKSSIRSENTSWWSRGS